MLKEETHNDHCTYIMYIYIYTHLFMQIFTIQLFSHTSLGRQIRIFQSIQNSCTKKKKIKKNLIHEVGIDSIVNAYIF